MKSKNFDPTIYQQYSDAISQGKKVRVTNHMKYQGCGSIDFSKDPEAEKLCQVECSTIEQFASEVYDMFILNIEPRHNELIWGINNQKNPIKDSASCYYDGLIFALCKPEYIGVLSEYTPERILSLAMHYGYGGIKVEII